VSTATTTQKKPRRLLEQARGVVPTEEEKNMTMMTQIDPAIQQVTAMCDRCGTTRLISAKSRGRILACATCRMRTHHSTPFASPARDHIGSKSSRDVARDIAALRRLGVHVHLDVEMKDVFCVRLGVDSVRTDIDFRAGLPMDALAAAAELVWDWLRKSACEMLADPSWPVFHDDLGAHKDGVPVSIDTARIEAIAAAENLVIEDTIARAAMQ
jgi:hypothetical protein